MKDDDPTLAALLRALLFTEAAASVRMSRDPDVGTHVITTTREDQP